MSEKVLHMAQQAIQIAEDAHNKAEDALEGVNTLSRDVAVLSKDMEGHKEVCENNQRQIMGEFAEIKSTLKEKGASRERWLLLFVSILLTALAASILSPPL